MNTKQSFFTSVCALAIPVALQSMLQSSFSIVDQIMIGQLGELHIAGVGFAGKFTSIYSVIIAAVGAVAGIMISQYLGRHDHQQVLRSFYTNLLLSICISLLFTLPCLLIPGSIMGLYTQDEGTQLAAAEYLQLISATFLPIAGATTLSALYRCIEKAKLPLYASIAAAILNTGLNWILIFGRLGAPALGVKGAALATVISQWANFLLMLLMLPGNNAVLHPTRSQQLTQKRNWSQYFGILLPILTSELLWSLGENVYAAIYGHLGTDAGAAMTLTNPVQGIVIGALSGLSQAAGIIVGKHLGSKEFDEAYLASRRLIRYGAIGAIFLSILVVLMRPLYVQIYQVSDTVSAMTQKLLTAYALVAPFKVLNMIMGSGILRSGGKTKYLMFIDTLGTWGFGVPLGLLSAFVWSLPVEQVYFLLSLEECIRFGISVIVFHRKSWMQRL